MFVGKHVRQLDDKGRLAIPAEYVNLLPPDERDALFVAPGAKGCIWLLPRSFYGEMLDRLVDSDDDETREQFLHYSQRRKLDKAGRILLDDDARAFAGLPAPEPGGKVGVVVCGTGHYLQVWDHDAYFQSVKQPGDFAKSLRKVAKAASRRTPEAGR